MQLSGNFLTYAVDIHGMTAHEVLDAASDLRLAFPFHLGATAHARGRLAVVCLQQSP